MRRPAGRDLRLADTVIALSATCEDETPLRYADVTGWAATATYALVESAVRLGREAGSTVHVGPVVTSGIFYDPDLSNVARWERLGHLGLEMEAGMLYTVAAVKGIEALAMMTVSDMLGATEGERRTDQRRAAAPGRRRHDPRRLPGGHELTLRRRARPITRRGVARRARSSRWVMPRGGCCRSATATSPLAPHVPTSNGMPCSPTSRRRNPTSSSTPATSAPTAPTTVPTCATPDDGSTSSPCRGWPSPATTTSVTPPRRRIRSTTCAGPATPTSFGESRWTTELGGWRLVGVDAQTLLSDLPAAHDEWEWLAGALAVEGPIGLFLHRPLRPCRADTPDEPRRYASGEGRRRLGALLAGAPVRLVGTGHVHQWWAGELDGAMHVWAPSTWAVLPDHIQPVIGTKATGVVEHALHPDGTVVATLLRPDGVTDLCLDVDIPSPYSD